MQKLLILVSVHADEKVTSTCQNPTGEKPSSWQCLEKKICEQTEVLTHKYTRKRK